MKSTVDLVAGARPDFMKLAPVYRELVGQGQVRARIVSTGQHYSRSMSTVFFRDLGIPEPEVELEVGPSGTAQRERGSHESSPTGSKARSDPGPQEGPTAVATPAVEASVSATIFQPPSSFTRSRTLSASTLKVSDR